MRNLVSVIALIAMTSVAAAQMPETTDVMTSDGVKAGTATKLGNMIYLRDAKGELVGMVELLEDGSRIVRDPSGKVTGTVSEENGKLVFHRAS
jgi:phage/plasmid primase-like uncharacterized protein